MSIYLLKIAIRITEWFLRCFTCALHLGLRNAWIVVVLARFSRHARNIRTFDGGQFYFRGKLDLGVVSHFYNPSYLIEDTEDNPIRTIVDAGANIGDETLRFVTFYPQATIVAVEPESSNLSILQKNFRLCSRVSIFEGGLWPTSGRLSLVEPYGGNKESFQVTEAKTESNSITAFSIPSILETMNWETIDILKLDIEGAEFELFTQHPGEWIDSVKTIVIEVADHERSGTMQALMNAISAREFDMYISGENMVLISRSTGWKFRKQSGLRRELPRK